MPHLLSSSLLAVLAIACGSADLISDPLIDRWCGGSPCAWETTGETEKVGTWHTDDYAIELLSDGSQISQLNGSLDAKDSNCFAFSLIAKIEPRARAFIELDFLDDGVIDFSQRIPTSDWDQRTFNISAPTWFHGVRFILRKEGEGKVILAEMRARDRDGTCNAPAIELNDRPDSADCERGDQCHDGLCAEARCVRCVSNAQCEEGLICGDVRKDDSIGRDCVEPGQTEFGKVCLIDAQCASGFCVAGSCSECREASDCDGATACKRSFTAPTGPSSRWPRQCDPERHLRVTDEPCASPNDCESGSCNGAGSECALDACPELPDDAQLSTCWAPCQIWDVTAGRCG